MELHRNDKIKIIAVLVILVGLVFDPFLVLDLGYDFEPQLTYTCLIWGAGDLNSDY